MAIHNGENFHALAAFREPHGVAAALGCCKRRIDETLTFIDRPFFTQRIGQLGEDLPQDLTLTPLLKPAMDRFVIWIALRQQMPLGPGVQNPEHRIQDGACRDRLASRAIVRDVLFGEVCSNPFPLVIAQPQHRRTYTAPYSPSQQF